MKRIVLLVALWVAVFAAIAPGQERSLTVEGLRCEYRVNPLAIDVRAPRLSWALTSRQRGQKQSAFQVLAASTTETLARNKGDLWDSGKVESDQSIHVVYAGKELQSRACAFWKVRVWDKNGKLSPWSEPGIWTMGLLDQGDWQAKWIADAKSVAEAAAGAARKPHNGYHSGFSSTAEATKSVTVDLGKKELIDAVRLYPARPYDWQPDTPGFLFPLRFRIEVAQKADFSDARTVVDRTRTDEPNPGTSAPVHRFAPATAQYVRLTVTRLRRRDGNNFGVALAEMQVMTGDKNLAQGAKVLAPDSIESGGWSKLNLLDGVLGPIPQSSVGTPLPATMVRKSFRVEGSIKRAIVFVTGLGLYELRINDRRVGDNLLAPEWTNYRKRIQYQAADVSKLLRPGNNAIGAMVGEGWYAGRLMIVGRNAYGSYPRFLLRLEIQLSDGRRQTIATDASWRSTSDGPIRSAEIYDGEVYDARKEMPGWDTADFDDGTWQPVRAFDLGEAELVWQRNEPIRVVKELRPVKMTEPKPGVYVFDMGQNMVGWCRLKVEGPAGTTVTIRHAEMLNSDGTLYTANLRSAQQTDRYVFRGNGEEVFEPHFTYHGFRYVELTGAIKSPTPDSALGRVFHSAAPDAGSFESSSELLNQLMRNIVWTQRGNLMSTPTDCPQRDERFGWMGDFQTFSQTAIFNMDMAAFLSKWVRDVRDDQADDGRFPDFAPHPGDPNAGYSGAPAWADAGTIVPWRTFENYADTRMLEEHFESVTRWIGYVRKNNPDLIWTMARGNNYNDWLNGDTLILEGWPKSGAAAPPDVFATAYFAHSTELVAKMAAALGRQDEARRYGDLFEQIKTAFNRRFVKPDGRIPGDTQAGYALALQFNLLPDEMHPKAAQRMVEGFKRYDGHLSTGIHTTRLLMLALTRNGYNDEAYRLLNLRTFPSWGYMGDHGATTIWERWDGYVGDRGFQNAGMNSFNHWAFGSVGEWIWRHVVGINPDEENPGYQHIVIRPRPGGGLRWVRGEYDSIRGKIASRWEVEDGTFTLDVTIPANTTAAVYVPARSAEAVTESGKPATQADGVKFLRMEEASAVFAVESGRYSFSSR